MLNQFSRTELLIGKEGMAKLKNSRVAVFGIGGVGGYVVEALARSGVGVIGIFDDDKVCITNLNRQLCATTSTIGRYKVDVTEERIKDINPNAAVKKYNLFYSPETSASIDLKDYDYVADAIDTVSCKIELIVKANESGVKVISCMGAGNKTNPAAFEVADIYETSVCPLAKVMRHELKKRGIKSLKVVYSEEPPLAPANGEEPGFCETNTQETARKGSTRRQTPGSLPFVPAVAGLIMAGEIIKDIIK